MTYWIHLKGVDMNKTLSLSGMAGLSAIALLILSDIVFRLGVFTMLAAGIGLLMFLFKR
jgi:hypothetical protein